MLTINQRGLVRTSVSSTEPITLAEAKLYLRIDSSAEDSLITDIITVVREHAEQYLKRSLLDQTWRLTLEDYAPVSFRLPMGPVRSITTVSLVDSDSNVTMVDSAQYALATDQDYLQLTSMLYASMVQITYQTGYANASDIPRSIRYGILSHIAALYDCRGEGTEGIPKETLALYSAYKEVLL